MMRLGSHQPSYILLWSRSSSVIALSAESAAVQRIEARTTGYIERHSRHLIHHHASSSSPSRDPASRSLHGPYLAAPKVTALITQCSTTAQLHEVLWKHRELRFNYIHASAAVVKLAKLLPVDSSSSSANGQFRRKKNFDPDQRKEPDDKLLACMLRVISVMEEHLNEMQPRAVANSLWAATRISSWLQSRAALHSDSTMIVGSGPPQSSEGIVNASSSIKALCQRYVSLSLSLLDRVPHALPDFQPQHFSNTALALAFLHSLATELCPRAQWGVYSKEHLMGLMSTLAEHSRYLLLDFEPQALANLLHSVVTVGLRPDEGWMSDCVDVAECLLPLMEPQHLSNICWALAKMDYHPGDVWISGMLGSLVPKLPLCTPQALSNILWAMGQIYREEGAGAHWQPGLPCWGDGMEALLGEISTRARHLGPQDCSNGLWALAVLFGRRSSHTSSAPEPSALSLVGRCTEVLVTRSAQTRGQASPQQLCNTLWAASLLLPPVKASEKKHTGSDTDRVDDDILESQDILPFDVPSFQNFPHQPISGRDRPLMEVQLLQIASELMASLKRCKPQELANAATGCARLGLVLPGPQPASSLAPGRPGFWPSFWEASFTALPSAEPRHLAAMIWSAAASGRVPPSRWTRLLLREATGRSIGHPSGSTLGPRGVACMLWSLGRLGLLVPLSLCLPGAITQLIARAQQLSSDGEMSPQALMMTLKAVACVTMATDLHGRCSTAARVPSGVQGKGMTSLTVGRASDLASSRHHLLHVVMPETVIALGSAFLSCNNLSATTPRSLVSGLASLAVLAERQPPGSRFVMSNVSEARLHMAIQAALRLEPHSDGVMTACLKRLRKAAIKTATF